MAVTLRHEALRRRWEEWIDAHPDAATVGEVEAIDRRLAILDPDGLRDSRYRSSVPVEEER